MLQLFPQNGDTAQTMTESGGNFAEAAYKGNPECQVYVLGSYPGQENFGKYAETVAKYDAMAVEGAKGISKRFPDRKPVLVIPVAQGFQEMGPKVGGVAKLYKDGIHANNEGKYLRILIHFATICRQDPHEAITSGLYMWDGRYSVSADYAQKAQDVAWEVVKKHPLSGVSEAATKTPAAAKPSSSEPKPAPPSAQPEVKSEPKTNIESGTGKPQPADHTRPAQASGPRPLPRPLPNHPGNVFLADEDIEVALPPGTGQRLRAIHSYHLRAVR
ncbi:MAG: hypothetical protein FJ291_16160 [Planctomycetes bacterium]|nr:hypothetical protein [Planctomycetota bacterium]